MPQTRTVVIVARTRMYGGRVCVGAMSDDGENIRLMNPNCSSDYGQDSLYRIGEKWQIICAPCGEKKPPHMEDMAVSKATKLGTVKDLLGYILQRAKPWTGGITAIFEGKIQFTQNGAGYVSEAAVPTGATGFWVPSTDLILRSDDRDKHGYYPKGDYRHLNYVGVLDPIERINAKQLVRVSLARWWKPRDADPGFEERCYAQLSGWY